MKLIRCQYCNDVIRLCKEEWRMCLCGESGGRYNEDNQTVVVSGKCEVFGIRNDFFEYEPFSKERREDNRDRLIEGEYEGDKQITRIDALQSVKIFSYGTLKNKDIQLQVFNTKFIIDKGIEIVEGYKIKNIKIDDEIYKIAIKSKYKAIKGCIINVPKTLLKEVDEWEGKHYKRINIKTKSGKTCMMYVGSDVSLIHAPVGVLAQKFL